MRRLPSVFSPELFKRWEEHNELFYFAHLVETARFFTMSVSDELMNEYSAVVMRAEDAATQEILNMFMRYLSDPNGELVRERPEIERESPDVEKRTAELSRSRQLIVGAIEKKHRDWDKVSIHLIDEAVDFRNAPKINQAGLLFVNKHNGKKKKKRK